MTYLTLIDFILTPFVLFIIFYLANFVKNRNIEANSAYEYYMPGLVAKIIGGISVCLIYTYYYTGGDTVNYFNDGILMVKMLFHNTPVFFNYLFNGVDSSNRFYFTQVGGYPVYGWDPKSFIVVRLTCLLVLASFQSFIVTTILLAWISYAGMWRLYLVFVSEFPSLKKQMAIAVLFVPSVFFWGSGLLKDTITLSAIGFYVYAFYKAFIKRGNMLSNGIVILIASYIIIAIKPYIFFALLPGSILWVVGSIIEKFKGTFTKFFVSPLLIIAALFSAYLTLEILGGSLQYYSVDEVMERAVVVQRDLKQDYYHGSSFDIGDFEANVPSMLMMSPKAISAALFRPFLWEINNPVMALSAIENTLMLILTIYLVLKVRIFKFIKLLFTHNLLVFSFIFSIFFAFSVGLTTSNFGSLVRYKIPLLPFYVASLFIVRHFDLVKSRKMEEAVKLEEKTEFVT